MRCALLLAALFAYASSAASRTIYVDDDAAGQNNGKNWANAFVDLQDALGRAHKNDQIWIAGGIYKPTSDDDPSRSFVLVDGVDLYGGYTGIGSERGHTHDSWTILSGDIGLETPNLSRAEYDDPAVLDNSYVVVDASGVMRGARLDGVLIQSCASYLARNDEPTAALYAGPATRGLQLNDVRILQTRGTASMILDHSHVDVVASEFKNNEGHEAGAVLVLGGTVSFTGTEFFVNESATSGGAIHAHSADVYLTQCSTSFGAAQIAGGQIAMDSGYLDIDRSHISYGGFGEEPNALGGNIALLNGARARVTNSAVDRGRANQGGGIYNDGGDLSLVHVTMVANFADGRGAGTLPLDGAAIYTAHGGVSRIANSIVHRSYHPETATAIAATEDGTTTIRASLIEESNGSGNDWNERLGVDEGMNIDAPPLFLEDRWRDYHLVMDSSGLDAADASRVPQDRMLDNDGLSRVFGEAPDMGAFELQCPTSQPLFEARVLPRTINLRSAVSSIHVEMRAVEHGWFRHWHGQAEFRHGDGWVRPTRVELKPNSALLEFSREDLEQYLDVGDQVELEFHYVISDAWARGMASDTVRVIGAREDDGPQDDFRPNTRRTFESRAPNEPYATASPNPFNPSTTIHYGLPKSTSVDLTVYDLAGRQVKTLVSGHVAAGDHESRWDGRDGSGSPVASGVYLYQLRAGDFVESKRMVLVK